MNVLRPSPAQHQVQADAPRTQFLSVPNGSWRTAFREKLSVIDARFYDARCNRLYISCGKGFIDVLERHGPDSYPLRERVPTSPGARTSLFSLDFKLFLADGAPSGRRMRPISPAAARRG